MGFSSPINGKPKGGKVPEALTPTPEEVATAPSVPPPSDRVTFDQVDLALSQVPLLVPRLRYWGSVWLIELENEGDKKGRVIFKSENERDYREVLDFALTWVRETLRDRLSENLGPIVVDSVVTAAERAVQGEIHER